MPSSTQLQRLWAQVALSDRINIFNMMARRDYEVFALRGSGVLEEDWSGVEPHILAEYGLKVQGWRAES